MLSTVYLNVLDTTVISPRTSGANNDFSDYPQLYLTVSVCSCCLWDCVWLRLYLVVKENTGSIFQGFFFPMFWKVHGIFYVSLHGHNDFMPLPPGVE